MIVVGIFAFLAILALCAIGIAIAVRFGVQWAISAQLPIIKKYLATPDTTILNESLPDGSELSETTEIDDNIKSFRFENVTSHPLVRLIFMGIICLAAMVPLTILDELIQDRSQYAEHATMRVAESWGNSQLVRGPAIWVPYQRLEVINDKIIDKDGNETFKTRNVWAKHYRLFLPNELNLTTDLQTQTRYSGIYPVPVYTAKITASGQLPKLSFDGLEEGQIKVDWSAAVLVTSVSDAIGLKGAAPLTIGNENTDANSGIPNVANSGSSKGFYYYFDAQNCAQTQCDFNFDFELNGVKSLGFSTTGKQTTIQTSSNWPHPSFVGNGLPDNKSINSQGFEAEWHVSNLVRSYPQIGDDYTGLDQFNEYTVSVDLVQPVNPYSMTIRAVKYGLLVIGMTLIGMFVFEQSINRQMHIVQYLIVVAALSLFYLTLLSLSEHIGFNNAWIAASAVIITMVCSYVGLVLKSKKYAFGLALFMAGVYTVMYALLRLEDYALLVGTVILLIIMIVVMNVTRKLNNKKPNEA
ncbi:MAG: cell envelope integrity protein CreD [Alphaproteobacteria bacterium]